MRPPPRPLSSRLSVGTTVSKKAFIEASDENYLGVRNLKLLAGRNLSAVDRENRSKVMVLGADVATELFDTTDVVGRKVKVDGDEFTVVGVLQNQGQSMGLNTGGLGLIPFTTAVGMGDGAPIESFYAKAVDEGAVEEAKRAIGSYLTGSANIAAGQFDVISQDEMLSAGSGIDDTMTLLLAGIAGISLVVAGIGVMNVMLVSVTERTREIGIKKALGARRSDILVQFLLEALIISVIGGALGIAAGIAMGMLSSAVGMAFVVSWNIVIVAVAASTAIGSCVRHLPGLPRLAQEPHRGAARGIAALPGKAGKRPRPHRPGCGRGAQPVAGVGAHGLQAGGSTHQTGSARPNGLRLKRDGSVRPRQLSRNWEVSFSCGRI